MKEVCHTSSFNKALTFTNKGLHTLEDFVSLRIKIHTESQVQEIQAEKAKSHYVPKKLKKKNTEDKDA